MIIILIQIITEQNAYDRHHRSYRTHHTNAYVLYIFVYKYQVCREYSQLIYRFVKNPILNTTVQVKDCVDTKILIIGGTRARPKEFPHMVTVTIETTVLFCCFKNCIFNRQCWALMNRRHAGYTEGRSSVTDGYCP